MNLKSGRLYEKHTEAILELGNHLLENRGKPRKPVSRWPVAGPSGCILTNIQQSDKQTIKKSLA
jgi:hypothetical protein